MTLVRVGGGDSVVAGVDENYDASCRGGAHFWPEPDPEPGDECECGQYTYRAWLARLA